MCYKSYQLQPSDILSYDLWNDTQDECNVGNFCDDSHLKSNVIFIACPALSTIIYNNAYNKRIWKRIWNILLDHLAYKPFYNNKELDDLIWLGNIAYPHCYYGDSFAHCYFLELPNFE